MHEHEGFSAHLISLEPVLCSGFIPSVWVDLLEQLVYLVLTRPALIDPRRNIFFSDFVDAASSMFICLSSTNSGSSFRMHDGFGGFDNFVEKLKYVSFV